MTIHVVTGPPCAGKSTWAAKSKGTDDPIVDYDALAKCLGSPGHHEHPAPIGQVAFAARIAAIARVFDGVDADAWILASFLTQEKVDEYAAKGCVFHLLDPGLDECLRRAKADGRPDFTADRIREWYESRPELPEATQIVEIEEQEKKMTDAQVLYKAFEVKALDESEEVGIFEGYASVFNNIDSYGDKVLPGAFTETLKEFGPDGAGISCYWRHRMDDLLMNIGVTLSAKQDAHGLLVRVKLDMDTERGRHAYKLLKEGRVREMSFAYSIIEGAWVEEKAPDGRIDEFYELRQLEIHEVSLVPIGANRETEITSVKTPGAESGVSCTRCAKCAQCAKSSPGEEPEQANAEEPTEVNAEEPVEAKQWPVESAYAEIAVMEMTASTIN